MGAWKGEVLNYCVTILFRRPLDVGAVEGAVDVRRSVTIRGFIKCGRSS